MRLFFVVLVQIVLRTVCSLDLSCEKEDFANCNFEDQNKNFIWCKWTSKSGWVKGRGRRGKYDFDITLKDSAQLGLLVGPFVCSAKPYTSCFKFSYKFFKNTDRIDLSVYIAQESRAYSASKLWSWSSGEGNASVPITSNSGYLIFVEAKRRDDQSNDKLYLDDISFVASSSCAFEPAGAEVAGTAGSDECRMIAGVAGAVLAVVVAVVTTIVLYVLYRHDKLRCRGKIKSSRKRHLRRPLPDAPAAAASDDADGASGARMKPNRNINSKATPDPSADPSAGLYCSIRYDARGAAYTKAPVDLANTKPATNHSSNTAPAVGVSHVLSPVVSEYSEPLPVPASEYSEPLPGPPNTKPPANHSSNPRPAVGVYHVLSPVVSEYSDPLPGPPNTKPPANHSSNTAPAVSVYHVLSPVVSEYSDPLPGPPNTKPPANHSPNPAPAGGVYHILSPTSEYSEPQPAHAGKSATPGSEDCKSTTQQTDSEYNALHFHDKRKGAQSSAGRQADVAGSPAPDALVGSPAPDACVGSPDAGAVYSHLQAATEEEGYRNGPASSGGNN